MEELKWNFRSLLCEHHVPAPYLRRAFQADHEAKANIIITALGFYELYLNGERITKGRLAPYISNPDDLVYYDTYEVTLRAGENVLGVWLGNGFTNNPGGHIWDFDIAAFRAAQCMEICRTRPAAARRKAPVYRGAD